MMSELTELLRIELDRVDQSVRGARRYIDAVDRVVKQQVGQDPFCVNTLITAMDEANEASKANELAAKYLRERDASIGDRAVLRATLAKYERFVDHVRGWTGLVNIMFPAELRAELDQLPGGKQLEPQCDCGHDGKAHGFPFGGQTSSSECSECSCARWHPLQCATCVNRHEDDSPCSGLNVDCNGQTKYRKGDRR